MAFVIKGIKPKKLKVDPIRLEILNALRVEGRTHVKEYQKTTQSWSGAKPKFDFQISLTGRDAAVLSGVSGGGKGAQKWQWLDEGTRPHTIVPRRARVLRFQAGYKAKTTPRRLSSRSGGARGPVVHARRVRHPGNKARLWTETLGNRRKRPFQRNVLAATRRGAQKMF